MDSLRGLQSSETDTILNGIDKIRSFGIGDMLELPQIIVCGDQSSGKSSVLNAVSLLSFPTKDTLCTRFATEVMMRPGAFERIDVSIVPSSDRVPSEKRNLESFRRPNVTMGDIAKIIDEATEAMGIDPRDPQARRFSKDILRFEVTGPTQPSLTLVDLPGLFQASSKDQTHEDTESVLELVLKYMKNKRSVILAVISAKSDFVLQSVTKHSRRVDPRGLRTLGIITKPDKLDANSDSEKKFLELAENQLAFLHRGWHVLVNRDYKTRDYTQDQRDQSERDFLSRGAWARLPSNHKGVFTLRSRLSVLLRDQILKELPSLIQDAENEIEKYQDKLHKLGVSRSTPEERRRYLTQASQNFNVTMRCCINGSYDGKFFSTIATEHAQQKRLRAVVQNTLLEFENDMQSHGHTKHIVDEMSVDQNKSNQGQITQKDFEDDVIRLMKRDRGRELPGTFNPLVVGELFVTQSMPWSNIISKYKKRIWDAAKVTIDLVLQDATDETTMARVKRDLIDPTLAELSVSLNKMIQKLLSLREEKHPITYNRSLGERIQKIKQKRAESIFAEKYAQVVGTKGETVSKATLEWLFNQECNLEAVSLERHAAREAIAVMRAYYKISKDKIIDNFGDLAIEDCLISRLPDLLSPERIAALDDVTIDKIAMETDEAASERADAVEKLEAYTVALNELMNIERMRQPSEYMLSIKNAPKVDLLKAFPLGGVAELFELSEAEVSDVDDTTSPLPTHLGTEVSKLDIGLSDHEDQQSLSTNPIAEDDLSKTKKKRSKFRDSWGELSQAQRGQV